MTDQEQDELEESVQSLLSQSITLSNDNHLQNEYKKSAKFFINKKFDKSYYSLIKILPESIHLYQSNSIEIKLFISIWSLYFNLIDIFVNKELNLLNNEEFDTITQIFYNPDYLFNELYKCQKISPPKLILLLLLIKLNNPKTDLIKLRSNIDLYLVNASSIFNPDINLDEYNDFKELLEIYHIHLLSKLNEYEESEFLISSNPHLINEKDELIKKLRQEKINIENEKKAKIEAEKKKKQQEKLIKERKEAKLKELKEAKLKDAEKIEKIDTLMPVSNSKELTILNIIKDKLLKLNSSKILSISIILSIFSILSILKIFKILNKNRNINEKINQFWTKLSHTLKMAFKVTYV